MNKIETHHKHNRLAGLLRKAEKTRDDLLEKNRELTKLLAASESSLAAAEEAARKAEEAAKEAAEAASEETKGDD